MFKKIIYIILFFNLFVYKLYSTTFPKFETINKINTNLNLISQFYNKNKNNINKTNSNLIPKKIHQIWIGPKPLPEKFNWMIKSWKKNHLNWEYKLWTNEDLKNFNLRNQKAYNMATNWGQKADIFRYEILYREGGLYIDIDFECLKNFDVLNANFDFYCGLIGHNEEMANGLIASKPKHPILLDCINALEKANNFGGNNANIINSTGPAFFTKIVINYLQKNTDDNNIIILPSTFFFAFPATQRKNYWNNKLSRHQIIKFIKPETFAIHYWATSWQNK